MSAEDVLYTERLRKSQADGIVALRRKAHEIAGRLDLFFHGLTFKPSAGLVGDVPTHGPINAFDLVKIMTWAHYEAERWDSMLDGMEGNERSNLLMLRDEARALERWIREDGREAPGPTSGLAAQPAQTVCAACGHAHAGPQLGGICIGCPCPEDGRA